MICFHRRNCQISAGPVKSDANASRRTWALRRRTIWRSKHRLGYVPLELIHLAAAVASNLSRFGTSCRGRQWGIRLCGQGPKCESGGGGHGRKGKRDHAHIVPSGAVDEIPHQRTGDHLSERLRGSQSSRSPSKRGRVERERACRRQRGAEPEAKTKPRFPRDGQRRRDHRAERAPPPRPTTPGPPWQSAPRAEPIEQETASGIARYATDSA